MGFERTLTLSEQAINRLLIDPALCRGVVPRLYRSERDEFAVEYGPTRVGDCLTTYAGFTIAMRIEDFECIKGRELHYDAHRGFSLRHRPPPRKDDAAGQ